MALQLPLTAHVGPGGGGRGGGDPAAARRRCGWRSSYAEGQESHELECHPKDTGPVTLFNILYIVYVQIWNIYPVTWCSGAKGTAAGAVAASFSDVSRDTQFG